ncbi:MAG: hypothetical protein LBJ00_07285 [Planctomycetaceae bacterium]|jgi:glycosyltransferase involved in cell wall biosynthesis|nr:hypothetical protein [Planctomycetaceae bacterium]
MKKRLIFDIANLALSGQPTMMGLPRYVVEILKRFIKSEKFDIVTICSLPEEEFAVRNLKRFLPVEVPFQSKNSETYTLPDKPISTQKTSLSKIEEVLKNEFPNSRFLRRIISVCRTIKWKISPPPFLIEHKLSPFYERLVKSADIYFSPSYKLIPELSVNPAIRKVLVVHDMIPIVLADMYKERVFFPADPWQPIMPDWIIFTVSESAKYDLLKYYPHVLPEQITPALLGADERFIPCQDRNKIESVLNKYSIPTNTPYILSVATLDIRKNFDHLMNCFTQWVLSSNEKTSDFNFVKIGGGGTNRETLNCNLVLTGSGGWQDRKFKNVFAHLPKKVREKIVFTGYVDDTDLPFLYNGAS